MEGLGALALAHQSVCVVLHTNTDGAFSKILGIDSWNERARAVAQVSQVTGSRWLASVRRARGSLHRHSADPARDQAR